MIRMLRRPVENPRPLGHRKMQPGLVHALERAAAEPEREPCPVIPVIHRPAADRHVRAFDRFHPLGELRMEQPARNRRVHNKQNRDPDPGVDPCRPPGRWSLLWNVCLTEHGAGLTQSDSTCSQTRSISSWYAPASEGV